MNNKKGGRELGNEFVSFCRHEVEFSLRIWQEGKIKLQYRVPGEDGEVNDKNDDECLEITWRGKRREWFSRR